MKLTVPVIINPKEPRMNGITKKLVWICVLAVHHGNPVGIAIANTQHECMQAGGQFVARHGIVGDVFGCFTPAEVNAKFPKLEWM